MSAIITITSTRMEMASSGAMMKSGMRASGDEKGITDPSAGKSFKRSIDDAR